MQREREREVGAWVSSDCVCVGWMGVRASELNDGETDGGDGACARAERIVTLLALSLPAFEVIAWDWLRLIGIGLQFLETGTSFFSLVGLKVKSFRASSLNFFVGLVFCMMGLVIWIGLKRDQNFSGLK